ncbi:hypothetical protein PL11201_190008 [Planktothrix sp. PCC 11201]|nr:hypothetical protein PL11201_190008 [Planktothrix sp. PCC 11201]
MTSKEGQSRSQRYGLPYLRDIGNTHRARLIIKTLKLGITGKRS